jgi:hypothetical protein
MATNTGFFLRENFILFSIIIMHLIGALLNTNLAFNASV